MTTYATLGIGNVTTEDVEIKGYACPYILVGDRHMISPVYPTSSANRYSQALDDIEAIGQTIVDQARKIRADRIAAATTPLDGVA